MHTIDIISLWGKMVIINCELLNTTIIILLVYLDILLCANECKLNTVCSYCVATELLVNIELRNIV